MHDVYGAAGKCLMVCVSVVLTSAVLKQMPHSIGRVIISVKILYHRFWAGHCSQINILQTRLFLIMNYWYGKLTLNVNYLSVMSEMAICDFVAEWQNSVCVFFSQPARPYRCRVLVLQFLFLFRTFAFPLCFFSSFLRSVHSHHSHQ